MKFLVPSYSCIQNPWLPPLDPLSVCPLSSSLKVPKIKKLILYEKKFLVPNYSCLQKHWLPLPDPLSLCPLSSTEFVEPPSNKIPGYATADN